MTSTSRPPLDGVLVVELCRYISGPYAARLLADLGADVIKVEDPATGGDPPRWMPGGSRAYSPQFASWNRGKRSVCLALKSPEGARAMRALLARADVLIENMRPGALDRLGLGDDELHELNPALVHCSLTGYGPDGPRRDDPSYDSIISAVSGLYREMYGAELFFPSGPSWSDLISGMTASQSVLAALRARDRDGDGQRVHVSMLNSVMDLINDAVTTATETGRPSSHDGRQRRQGIVTAEAEDNLQFVVQFGERQAAWDSFVAVVERPDLATDPRFESYHDRIEHHHELLDEVRPAIARRPREYWLERFAEVDLPCAPVNDLTTAVKDPHVVDTGLLEVDSGSAPTTATRPSAQIAPAAVRALAPAPDLGEHTSEVLEALDLAHDDRNAILAANGQAYRPERKRT